MSNSYEFGYNKNMATATASTHQTTTPHKAVVLYDGQCELCRRGVELLKRLDWLKRFTCQDARDEARLPVTDPPLNSARLLEEMHLVTPDGRRVYHGFGVIRWMAWRLPLLVPVAPLLYLPGVPALGQRLYLWIARRRFHLAPCSHGECRVQRETASR